MFASGILLCVRFRRGSRSDDEPLLCRSVDDPAAFGDFYRAYVDRVVVYFARRTFDAETALDLTGETFAIALECREQFRGSDARRRSRAGCSRSRAASSAASSTAGRSSARALVRLGCDPPGASTADLEWVERLADLPSLRATVRTALEDLPSDQAYAVTARVVNARDYAELAGELNVTEQVVRARVSRGLRAMAETLDDPRFEERR